MAGSRRPPLDGIRVIDLSRLAPGPYCSMILADLGADVIVAGGGAGGGPLPQVARGKQFVSVNLKTPAGQQALQGLVADADVLIEGFRPGVAARLGVDYDTLAAIRPDLVYCSVTGYGQTGPLASAAGHDINYLALVGVLGAIGPVDGPPVPPLNLIADFAGGSYMAVISILAALRERESSGRGQYLDVAMIDGVQSMMTMHYATWGSHAMPSRGDGLLSGTAPFYRCYECADGRYVAVGALETQFFATLWQTLDLGEVPDHLDRTTWRYIESALGDAFLSRDRDHWRSTFDGLDACVSPVLGPDEVALDPHVRHRHGADATDAALPLPRLDATRTRVRPTDLADATPQVLSGLGLTDDDIAEARSGSGPAGTLATWPPS